MVFNISLEWLRMNKNERFFLFIHTYEIHTPYSPDLEFARAIENDYNGTLPRTITKKLLQSINRKKRVSNEDKRHIVAMYDANIMEMDADFWDFMDSLKRLGLYNDTIIVFTSDHGEEFGEHGMMGWHSHTLYNELLKIPLIIKLPADNAKGKVINELVRSIDIAPTILDILKIKAPPYYEGDSLMPLINENRWGIEYAVSEKESYRCGNSIQNLEWKYYCDKLYRLPLDPKERQSSKDNFPGEYYHLTEVMERWVKFSVPNKTVAYIPLQNVTIEKFYTQENQANASGKLGNKTLEQLRSLGYLS
jgi:arylsulfatase A-like enzyme